GVPLAGAEGRAAREGDGRDGLADPPAVRARPSLHAAPVLRGARERAAGADVLPPARLEQRGRGRGPLPPVGQAGLGPEVGRSDAVRLELHGVRLPARGRPSHLRRPPGLGTLDRRAGGGRGAVPSGGADVKRALLVAALLAGCRSYSDESVDALYREVLQWAGRDDAAAARRPSEPHWEAVAGRKSMTLADAYRIALTQSERIARAAEGYIQMLAVQDQALAAVLPAVGVQAIQFYQDPVPSSFTSGIVTTSPNRRQVAVTLAQPIFHGLREFAARRQAQAN